MALLHVTVDTFQQEVLESTQPVILDFYADWCGPCRMIAPVLEEIAAENPDVKVCKVNVDKDPQLAIRYQVASIPLLLAFRKRWAFAQKSRFWRCLTKIMVETSPGMCYTNRRTVRQGEVSFCLC